MVRYLLYNNLIPIIVIVNHARTPQGKLCLTGYTSLYRQSFTFLSLHLFIINLYCQFLLTLVCRTSFISAVLKEYYLLYIFTIYWMSLMSLNITLVLRRYNKRMSLVCQIATWLHCIYANKDGKIVEKFYFIDTKSKHMQCCSLLQECQILNLKDIFHKCTRK